MMMMREPVHWMKIFLDIFSIVVLVVLYILIAIFGKPFHTSFNCDDFSINMPFKRSTVTNLHLIYITLLIPLVFISFTEFTRIVFKKFHHSNERKRSNYSLYIYKVKIFKKVYKLSEEIGNIYINCGSFFFGFVATLVITEFLKIVVGRLRPNFLDVCKPAVDPYVTLCTNNMVTHLKPEVDFNCTSFDIPSIEDSRKSFPSGHSSLAFYSLVFLILYINYSWSFRRFGLFPRFIQFFLFTSALYVSISRIVDNKHHPTDVIAGALLGLLTSYLTFVYLTDYTKVENYNRLKSYSAGLKINDDQTELDDRSLPNSKPSTSTLIHMNDETDKKLLNFKIINQPSA